MPELTAREADVLDVVRTMSHGHEPVATWLIKERLLPGVSYDGVDRALRGLLRKGMVDKPSRGFWLAKDGTHV